MDIILTSTFKLFAFVFAIVISILVHELCHFLAARYLNVKISSFSIGFGKPLFKWYDKHGITYVLAPILLGGYVKMPNSQDPESKEIDISPFAKNINYRQNSNIKNTRSIFFDKASPLTRLIIILAGVTGNFLLALCFFWITSINTLQFPKAIIGNVDPNSQAAYAKLYPNDQIIALNNHSINTWSDLYLQMLPYLGNKNNFSLTIKKNLSSQLSSRSIKPISNTSIRDVISQHSNLNETMEGDSSKNNINNEIQIIKTPPIFSLNYDKKNDPYQLDLLKDILGITPYHPIQPAIIYSLEKHGPAKKFGLRPNDLIVTIDKHAIKNWDDFLKITKKLPNKNFFITIKRNNTLQTLTIKSSWRFDEKWQKIGYLGIRTKVVWPPDKIFTSKYNLLPAIPHALEEVWDFIRLNTLFCEKLITGKVSLHMLGGPLTIFQSSSIASQQGFLMYLKFLAILNITLIIANLLPIPGLDGGYFIFLAIEAILKKQVQLKTQALIYRIGIIFLVLLMTQALINDFIRLLGN